MPLLYLPKYMRDIDYKLLRYLDTVNGKSEITFEILDHMEVNLKTLEKSFKKMEKEGLVRLHMDKSAIIGLELTDRGHALLAEHILIRKAKRKS